jgi:prefoldin subunit 5
MAEAPKTKLERQKIEYDSAISRARKNAPNAEKSLKTNKNYLDELSDIMENAGQTATEKAIFQKETVSSQLGKPGNSWWD